MLLRVELQVKQHNIISHKPPVIHPRPAVKLGDLEEKQMQMLECTNSKGHAGDDTPGH